MCDTIISRSCIRKILVISVIYTKAISNFNLSQLPEFAISIRNFAYSGRESISFIRPKIWELMPSEMKEQESLEALRFAIAIGCLKIVRAGCAKVTLDLFKCLYLPRPLSILRFY